MGWREAAAAAGVAILFAVALNWPIAVAIRGHVPGDLADPLLQAWQIAWGGQALQTQPLDYFDANAFYPNDQTLAFSDALVGYAPAGLVGEGPDAAILRYNVLFLFSHALAFWGTYLLAR